MKTTRRGFLISAAIAPAAAAFAELKPGESKLIEGAALDRLVDPDPSALRVALFDRDGTEISGDGYARQPIEFKAAEKGYTENVADVTWPSAGESWGTLEGWGLIDDSGALIAAGRLNTAKKVSAGDVVNFMTGDLGISIRDEVDVDLFNAIQRRFLKEVFDR